MGKKKKYRGHYCWVCSRIRPNEKFSGKGHKKHICKACSRKTPEEIREIRILNDIYSILYNRKLSKNNRKMLQDYLNDKSEKVRKHAQDAIDECNEYISLMEQENEYELKMIEEYEKQLSTLEDNYTITVNKDGGSRDGGSGGGTGSGSGSDDDHQIPF